MGMALEVFVNNLAADRHVWIDLTEFIDTQSNKNNNSFNQTRRVRAG